MAAWSGGCEQSRRMRAWSAGAPTGVFLPEVGRGVEAAPRRRRARSLTSISTGVAAALAVIAIAVVATLLATTIQQEAAAVEIADTSAEILRVREAERDLLLYRTLADLDYLDRETDMTLARERARVGARALSDPAHAPSDESLRDLRRSAAAAVDAYLREREQWERSGASLTEIVRRTRPLLDAALARLATLDLAASGELARARRDASSVARVAIAVSVATSILLLVVLTGLALALDREVTRPLHRLSAAIRAFRAGDTTARAPLAGVRELVEAAETFDDMADALGRQRQSQLAYLAGVVHDLRSPLGALRLGIDALRAPRSTATTQRTLALCDRQIERLSRLVSDVMDAAQIEAGRLSLSREVYDLRRSIGEVVELFEPTTERHEIVIAPGDAPLLVDADPVRMEQVLGNLLGNAIKYSPAGGTITVRARETAGHVCLEVVDHGIGIAREALPDLFTPFRRHAPPGTPGAGLGLSVSKRIVEAHGGSIEVESELGRGSTFRVRLPSASHGAQTAAGGAR